MWVFVRPSMNFAHTASFQAMEFVYRPVQKMLDILVCCVLGRHISITMPLHFLLYEVPVYSFISI